MPDLLRTINCFYEMNVKFGVLLSLIPAFSPEGRRIG